VTVTAIDTKVTVALEAACLEPACSELAFRMRNQLDTPNYTRGVALMPVPASLDEWRAEHRTARKRADRADRLGYRFATIDRSQHNDAIHEINTSLSTRQGRPMSDGYVKRHNHGALPDYPCDRHAIRTYGVLQDETLRAYLSLYVVGDLRLVSMILGHGDHLDNGIMYLLFHGVVAAQAGAGGWFYYNRWDSGEEGLRFLKARLGFTRADVEWRL
jgi:hypothetical protein